MDIVYKIYWIILVLYSWKWKSLSRVWFFASPWNSPGQNTGVGSLSLLQEIFPTQDQTQVSLIAGGFFTSWATREVHYTAETNVIL